MSGSVVAYNNDTAPIVGWAKVGNFTFKNITIGPDVTIYSLWDSYDTSLGGIVGTLESPSTVTIDGATISCKISAFNDVCGNYQYYAYRRTGMIIGNMDNTKTVDGRTTPDPKAAGVTCKNVVVNYGDWMNYHYCRVSGQRAVRVEPGYSYGGIAADRDHSKDNAYCMECIPFNQLIGGNQLNVKGLPAVDGVTVNYPASFNSGE
jgi:hypothetical protein